MISADRAADAESCRIIQEDPGVSAVFQIEGIHNKGQSGDIRTALCLPGECPFVLFAGGLECDMHHIGKGCLAGSGIHRFTR